MITPCIDVCTLDPVSGWCAGCGRTGAEIARWIAMDDGERLAIMAALPERLSALEQSATVNQPPVGSTRVSQTSFVDQIPVGHGARGEDG